MKLKLQNFRCHSQLELDFGDRGLVLLAGSSGHGKSTICEAIKFALCGSVTRVQTHGDAKLKTLVELEIGEYKIVRQTSPKLLKLTNLTNGMVYTDAGAQAVINRHFPKFETTSYISQRAMNSFVELNPTDKLEFLESIAFSHSEINEKKERVKAVSKEYETKRTELLTELRVRKEQFEMIEKPKKVEFPLDKTQAKELIKTHSEKLESLKREKLENEKLYHSAHAEHNSLVILQTQLQNIDAQQREIENQLAIISELRKNIGVFDNEASEKLASLHRRQKEIQKLKVYENEVKQIGVEYATLENEEKLERERRESEIKQYEQLIWSSSVCNEKLQLFEESKLDYTDLQTKKKLEREKASLSFDANELMMSEELEAKLADEIDKLLKSKTVYTCPSCNTSLRVNENKLEVLSDCVPFSEKVLTEKIKQQKEVGKRVLHSRMTFERIKQIDFELDELGEFEEALIEKEYNEFESAFSKQKELKSKLQILKNTPILPSSLVRQRKNLEGRKKNLEKPIVNEEFEMTSSSEELLRDIQRKSEFTEYTNRCELHETNISKLKAKRNEFREAHLRKYGEIKLTIDLDLLYQRGKELEDEIEEATKIMNQIDEYKKYKKAKKQYSELEEKIREFEREEKRVSRLLTASYELTKKIQEAESLAIASLLEELNIRSQEYFELFFPNDPITIQLSSFKENKNAVIKPVINLKIFYKGHEIDLNTLSGGERDRVVLVYTLVLVEMFNIPLLILDESTSSLDQELTLTVLEGIKNRFNNKLVLIVAHQIIEGTLDRVIQL